MFGGGIDGADDGFVDDKAALLGGRWNDLGNNIALLHFFRKDLGQQALGLVEVCLYVLEVFIGFDGKVCEEDGRQFQNHRTCTAHHDIDPFSDAGVLFEITRVDKVEAAGVTDFAVDNEDFAVVAQVGTRK